MFKNIQEEIKKYYRDFYNGRVKVECDEDCPEDCDGDHGYYECPLEYKNLFEEEETQK